MRSDPSGRDGDVGYMAPGDFSDLDFSPLFRPVAKQVARGVIVKYSPLAKRLLDHYMDESGTTYTLTEQDMSDVRVRIDLRNSPQFEPLIASLNGENDFEPVEDTEILLFSGSAGTLGRFMGVLNGEIRGTSESDWSFSGTIRFKDTYDFDPQPWSFPNTSSDSPSARAPIAEAEVRLANIGIPGKGFEVRSVSTPLSQTSDQNEAEWVGKGRQSVMSPPAD